MSRAVHIAGDLLGSRSEHSLKRGELERKLLTGLKEDLITHEKNVLKIYTEQRKGFEGMLCGNEIAEGIQAGIDYLVDTFYNPREETLSHQASIFPRASLLSSTKSAPGRAESLMIELGYVRFEPAKRRGRTAEYVKPVLTERGIGVVGNYLRVYRIPKPLLGELQV